MTAATHCESFDMKYYLIVDLEMGEVDPKDRGKLQGMSKEIIQTGAVLLTESLAVDSEFSSYSRPRIGYVSHYVRKMTGITNDRLKGAPDIEDVLRDMADWLGDKEVIAMSWSDSDCRQLEKEMEVKEIHIPEIERLFPGWADFQVDFGRLAGFKERCSLADALLICHLSPDGREHDGLWDARNTARIFAKVQGAEKFSLSLTPIHGKGGGASRQKKERLWTPDRVLFALRHGRAEAKGDSYLKYRFAKKMRRV